MLSTAFTPSGPATPFFAFHLMGRTHPRFRQSSPAIARRCNTVFNHILPGLYRWHSLSWHDLRKRQIMCDFSNPRVFPHRLKYGQSFMILTWCVLVKGNWLRGKQGVICTCQDKTSSLQQSNPFCMPYRCWKPSSPASLTNLTTGRFYRQVRDLAEKCQK